MVQRVRQLTVMWLVLVLALLPVSGHLLAMPHTGAGHDMSFLGMHTQDVDVGHTTSVMGHHGFQISPGDLSMSAPVHDCHGGLCAGSCGGCVGCHAPPAHASSHSIGTAILGIMLSLPSPTPPPSVFYRPPQHTTA